MLSAACTPRDLSLLLTRGTQRIYFRRCFAQRPNWMMANARKFGYCFVIVLRSSLCCG